MARTFTRSQAISYLQTNPNWLWLQMQKDKPTDPATLREKTVLRYARNFYTANELDKREFATLAEARGHGAGEHHKGRKQKRAPGYVKPSKWPRGRFNQPIAETPQAHGAWRPSGRAPRVHAGYVRNTSGEGMAKRELVLAANAKQTVYINVLGTEGRYKALFSRSGYRADLLLAAAGYKQNGMRWVKARPGAGLEQYLLSIIPLTQSNSGNSDVEAWGRIVMYQIIVDEEAVAPAKRRKRDAWPGAKPGFKAGAPVQSLPTKSVRKAKLDRRKAPNVRGKPHATTRK
jgi:hypothetical protein